MKQNKQQILQKHPILNKVYGYLDEQSKQKSKTRTLINNFICTIIMCVILTYLAMKNNVFGKAGIIFYVLNICFSSFQIYKKNYIKWNIVLIVIEVIFVIANIFLI